MQIKSNKEQLDLISQILKLEQIMYQKLHPKLLLLFFLTVITSFLNAQNEAFDVMGDIIKEKIKSKSTLILPQENNAATLRDDFSVKLTDNEIGDEAEPFIVVNPADSTHLLISYIDLPGNSINFPIYVSNDAGDTWTRSDFNPQEIYSNEPFTGFNIAGGGDPVFAFDDQGDIYFSWIFLGVNFATFDTRFISFWAKSEDGGITWNVSDGEKKYIETGSLNLQTQTPGNFGAGVFDRPWLDVDRSGGPFNGTLYSSGFFWPGPDTVNDTSIVQTSGMIIKRKLVGVDSFEQARIQVSEGDFAQYGNVKISNSGTVHVTFGNIITNEAKHSFSTDGGETFSNPTTIGTFSPGQQGQVLVNDRENPAMNFALDYSNNNLYAVWNSLTANLSGFFTFSHDEGLTWSSPQSIAELAGVSDHQVFMPNIASNNKNEVSISWYDLDSEDVGNYMVMNSKDGGLTWEEPVPLTDAATDFKNYVSSNPQVPAPLFGDYYTSVKVGCKTFSVWSDGRQMNGPKIYVSSTDFCNLATSVSEITAITDQIQIKSLYPNPTNGEFSLDIELKSATAITMEIYDVKGKLMRDFPIQNLPTGSTSNTYDITDLAPATYLVVVKSPLGNVTRKLVVVE